MKYIKIPFEKIVKYDEENMASIICPICDRRDFTVIISKSGRITLFCNNDDFSLTRMTDLTFKATYSVYENLSDEYEEKRDMDLNILFRQGLITYLELTAVLKQGLFKNV